MNIGLLCLLTRTCKATEQEVINGHITYFAQHIKKAVFENGAIGKAPLMGLTEVPGATYPTINGIEPETYKTWQIMEVNPYFACHSALGLCKVGDDECKNIVKNYINWHFKMLNTKEKDHNNIDGTIYDITIFANPNKVNGETQFVQITNRDFTAKFPIPQAGYDSIDSYAALFITLLKEYTEKFNDQTVAAEKKADLDRVISALLAVFNEDLGLTVARPDYPLFFIMDNVEVYQGFIDAAWIYRNVYKEEEKAKLYEDKAKIIATTIETKAWNKDKNCYYSSIGLDGANTGPDLAEINVFYPLGAIQLFPILYRMPSVTEERANTIYNIFKTNFLTGENNWITLNANAYPWGILTKPLVIAKDKDSVLQFVENVKTQYKDIWYFHPWEAGNIICGLDEILHPGPELPSETPVVPNDEESSESDSSETEGNISDNEEKESSESDSSETESFESDTIEVDGNIPNKDETENKSDKSDINDENPKKDYTPAIIGGVIGGIVVIGLVIGVVVYINMKKKQKGEKENSENAENLEQFDGDNNNEFYIPNKSEL